MLVIAAVAGVEDDAVASLQRAGEADVDAVTNDASDFADEGAALFSEAGVDELLVVNALKPAGGKATAEGHLHFVFSIFDFRLTRGCRGSS